MWVTDATNNRIDEFSGSGALIAAFGSQGTGAGQYEWPAGIAVNQKTGNIYVTEVGNHRVDELSSSGTFIRMFGWGVSNGEAKFETCTSSCKVGIAGSGAGQLYYPHGLTIDSSGDLWITEETNARVQEFSETGGYVKAFGSAGTGAGQFGDPTSIAIAGGDFYIADYTDNRVDEFSTGGTFVKAIGWGVSNGEAKLKTCTSSCQDGIAGTGNGQFDNVRGITADPLSGNLYMSEVTNNRVQELTTTGTFVAKFGASGSGPGQFAGPKEVVASSTGAIYITDYEHARVQEWERPTWWPTAAKGALSIGTTYVYAPVEGNTGTTSMQPYEVLAPAPAGVTCGTKVEELKNGCRALTFEYATATTATGENSTEWGSYKGHLAKVWFRAYSTTLKEMTKVEVARYEYDGKGRLRVEWDPRIESSTACGKTCSALKTTYGYDLENHVTTLTPSGQQPWAFSYGTIAGDSNTGRLLKVTRAYPKASWSEKEVTEKLSEQALSPKDTVAPAISGSPAVGVRLAVSNGTWSESPFVYGYQWEDCNSEGKTCAPILGATNQNYTPVSGDVGHTLVAEVTAANGDGSVVASSAASTTVLSKAGAYTQTVDSGYSLNAVSCIPSTTDCVLSDSAGMALYATNVSTSASATWKTWSGPSGESPSQAVDCPSTSLCLLADGKETAGGKLYYATSLGGAFGEAYSPSYGVDAISCVSSSFCVDGQDGYGYFRYSTSPASTSWTLEDQAEASMKGVFCLSTSFCAIADSSGKVHVANSTSQIESSTWKETDVDGSSALNGIACTSTTSCVAVDGAGNALKLTIESSGTATAVKHNIDGTTSLTAVTCSGSSACVAVDASGNIFVSKNAGETWSKEYALGDKLTSVSCASTSLCATADTTGNVTVFNPAGGTGTSGESHAPQPGSTIEYDVPLSGSESSHLQNLTKGEVEKWGQKDDPVEAAAIIPPDEPQSWPASTYKRATVHYWDSHGRTVNTAIPTGGVATNEYNAANETTRTLSADNRAAALKEECKSAEKHECKSAELAEKIDTKTEYNSEETNILKMLGPEHKIKLSTGEEVLARAVTHDYYDEGAKEAEEKNKETYDLLTKTTSGALLSGGEEKDVRTTATSYSGQNDLGWKLRKATSTTIEPSGLNLTTTKVYNETTGDVVETRSPKGSGSGSPMAPVYLSQFGSAGTGAGQFKGPVADAIDASGDVWVADYNNSRVEEFSAAGAFIKAIGWGVGNGKSELETCTSGCQAGISGSGEGQFSKPAGIAINQATGDVYVVDKGNNRIEEFEAGGKFVRKFGTLGSEKGQLNNPLSIAITPTGSEVWVGDALNNRIDEFSETGTPIGSFGKGGTGNGEFSSPDGIAFSDGNAYVVDTGNNRVQEFSMAGKYIAQFGSKGAGNGQFEGPYGITADPVSGDLYVGDHGNNRIEEFTSGGTFLDVFAKKGSGNGELLEPEKVAINTAGDIYVADVGNNRIEEWEPVPASPIFGFQFGVGDFAHPDNDAVDAHGNVWVTNQYGTPPAIEEFSPTGTRIATYGEYGEGKGKFKKPEGIAINQKTGNVYVPDGDLDYVEELNEKGEYIQTIGSKGTGSGQIDEPSAIAVDSSGNIWVADYELGFRTFEP